MKILTHKTLSLEERIVNTMLLTLLVLALGYCAILLSLVFSVIARKEAVASTKDVASELSSVESEYGSKITAINDQMLASKHFVRVEGTAMAVRKDPIASYTVLYDNR